MINLLKEYIPHSLPVIGENSIGTDRRLFAFATNPGLRQKVDGRKLLPFYGNTVVFLLDQTVKEKLEAYQQELYEKAGWMLAEPLHSQTFHMTLHDLHNGPQFTPDLAERMSEAEEKVKMIWSRWENEKPLHMKATWLFNMVNTSIVLGLEPADKISEQRLDAMHLAMEPVVKTGEKWTPHITVAYFRPDTYTVYDLKCLQKALHPVELNITLNMKDLVLQKFTDMNHYDTVQRLEPGCL